MKEKQFNKKIKILFKALGIATFIALMSAAIYITTELGNDYYRLTSEDVRRIFPIILNELTAAYSFLLLIPLMIYFFKTIPLSKDTIVKHILYYLLFSIIIGLTHTVMMYGSRIILYPLFGFGNFDIGYLPFRIIMEYLKQLGLFWVVYIIYTLFKTFKEKEEQRLKTVQLEEQLTKARLETLKMQLNPHFLFNTLNMISSAMYEDIQAADKMLATLSDLLRITLKNPGKGVNTIEKEIEILDLYIDIMKARFKDKLKVNLNIQDETLTALIPNFLFQPIVENSIKYGMESLNSALIEISTRKSDDKLKIYITDNGPGIHEEFQNVLNNGVGLSNTVERLEKLYGSNYEFNWVNLKEGGLQLNIEIPFEEGMKVIK